MSAAGDDRPDDDWFDDIETPTIGSLFSGIGCLDRAVEIVTGGYVMWQVEQVPYRRGVLWEHFPTVPVYEDVCTFAPPSKTDILCGGFPCRDISPLGSKEGLDGKKSGLWSEYRRIIEATQTGAVFVENVRDLRTRGLDRVLRDLAKLGYDTVWTTTRGSDTGLYFGRPRIFLLAVSTCTRRNGHAPAWLQGSEVRRVHDADRCDAGLPWPADGPRQDYDGPEPGLLRTSLGPPAGVVARHSRARLAAVGDTVSIPQAVAAYRWCIEQYRAHTK